MKKLILLFVCLLVASMFAFGATAQEAQAATTIKVINSSIPGKHNLKSIENILLCPLELVRLARQELCFQY